MRTVSQVRSVAEIHERPIGFGERPESAICYRMESAKRLLHCGECSVHQSPPPGLKNFGPPCLLCDQSHTVLDLEQVRRVALLVTPEARGDIVEQTWEAISTMRAILRQQSLPMTVTLQTVFLRRAEDAEPCRRLFQSYFGVRMPATNFVVQPPCNGQALAIEAWALGGENTRVEFPLPDVVTVAYDGLRWIHIGGISQRFQVTTAYSQAKQAFDAMARRLELSGSSFRDVVRTWLYQGGINDLEFGAERYRELNRARTDFFAEQEALGQIATRRGGGEFYPASTGIGMAGHDLTVSCLALQTKRSDVRCQPLENPRQTPAFNYAASYSTQSPKFSRAMAVVIGNYLTTWISGTASIVNSESVHLGDVKQQTEQTIDNIEALISPDNFARHGLAGAGCRLGDLAKVRVYLRRAEDYEKCRAICDRRFGNLPTIYAQADICRSNLLVEIEGVTFSRLRQPAQSRRGA